MKKCSKYKLAIACKNKKLINRYKRLYALKKIDLSGADLRGADLSGANLQGADLSGANLQGADLSGADLRGADLSGVNLSCAYLHGANLYSVNLRYADLRRAALSGANLRRSNLYNANLSWANLVDADLREADLRRVNLDNIKHDHTTAFLALQCPEEGAFIGWKKCKDNVIVKLLIPAESKRSSATTRKCRAEFVDVLEILGAEEGISKHDNNVVYKKGERIICDNWDEDRWNECSGGIHFFLTREEAENY